MLEITSFGYPESLRAKPNFYFPLELKAWFSLEKYPLFTTVHTAIFDEL